MNFQRDLSEEARQILLTAQAAASNRHSRTLEAEHLLLALLEYREAGDPLRTIFAPVDRGVYIARLGMELGIVRDEPSPQTPLLNRDTKIVLEDASKAARQMGQAFINGGHLLIGLFSTPSEIVKGLLKEMGLDSEKVREQVKNRSQNTPVRSRAAMPEIVLEDYRTQQAKRQRERQKQRAQSQRYINPYTPYVLAGLGGLLLYLFFFQRDAFLPFVIVFGGWMFSLTLHEYSHAIVAYWGGDHTVKDKGYLTFNPLYYTHPLISILLPMFILLLGGLGLPGGAVFIEIHRLRSPYWRSAVSLAGPAANAVFAVILALPFALGILDVPDAIFFDENAGQLEGSLAFLIFLQVTAVFLNLLPIPPLDGFNALSPFLPPDIVRSAQSFGMLGFFFLFFVVFNVPVFNNAFFGTVQDVLDLLRVPWNLVTIGYDAFRFWQ